MKKRNRWGVFLLFLYITIWLSGVNGICSEAVQKKYRVMAILPQENNPFWKDVWNGIREETQKASFALSEYEFSDISEENMWLDIASKTEADGILLCPKGTLDDEFYRKLEELRQKGTKIAILDTDIPEEYRDAFLGIDNYVAGKTLAYYLCNQLEPKQHVVLLRTGDPLSSVLQARINGFQAVMEEKQLSEYVQVVETLLDTYIDIEDIVDVLTQYDTPIYLVAIGPNNTLKAANIVSMSNLSSHVSIIGFGETEEAFKYVENGTIQALIVQDNFDMGKKGVEIMEGLLKEDGTVSDIEDITISMVTSENISDYIQGEQE